jgi:sec-independent protein translocase protein TatA
MNIVFFISGGEIAIIILIVVMVFGADKIPDIARNLGKAVKSVKNATDDIKNEITKSSDEATNEMNKVDISKQIDQEASKVKEDIEEITGPIKRRF